MRRIASGNKRISDAMGDEMSMFEEKKPLDYFPRYFNIANKEYTIRDKDHYDYLNRCANMLYATMLGYPSRDGFDYFSSPHPQESNSFTAAMIMTEWIERESGTE